MYYIEMNLCCIFRLVFACCPLQTLVEKEQKELGILWSRLLQLPQLLETTLSVLFGGGGGVKPGTLVRSYIYGSSPVPQHRTSSQGTVGLSLYQTGKNDEMR